MRYIRMLFAVLTGTLFFISIAPRVIAGPDNTTYRVRVVSSFGTIFNDCFRFDTPNPGDLTIDLLFQVITYRHGQLDTAEERFKAVSRSFQPLAIMFFGEAIDPLDLLTGEAVNEFGDTFVFTGRSVTTCLPVAFAGDALQSTVQGNPYSR
jgi:hypothetical protein